MKELLLQYAEYNVWANKRITDALLQLEDAAVDQAMISSFTSIRATVQHTWGAEYIWLQRLQEVANPVWVDKFQGTFEAACKEWETVSGALLHFTERQYDDKWLRHVIEYHNRAGEAQKTPVFQVLHHVFNHSTYHRGQLVTMLRQAGATEIPGTDFIGFVRGK